MTLHEAFERYLREAGRGEVDTGRYRMRYFAWGDGPLLLMTHGLTDLARSFVPLAARLASRYRCVAYEQPHGGRDGARVGAYRHADFVADLVALADHFRARRAYLLALSFGTTVALQALHSHPDRFPAAVLQGGFARRPLSPPERALARVARYFPRGFRLGDLPGRERTQRELDGPAFAGAEPVLWPFFLANSGYMPARTAASRALLLDRLDLRPLLPGIRQPVLMVGGDADKIVPFEYEREVLTGLPDTRRLEFSPCGHYPQYTHADRMADAIVDFLHAGA